MPIIKGNQTVALPPAQQEAAIAAQQQTLAASDLVTLQTFQALALNPATTIGQLQGAFNSLPASLGDPARIAAIQVVQGGFQSFLDGLATLISKTNAAAGN